jgi:hypothetical protein
MGLRKEFEKWKRDNDQSGTLAWSRFAMFEFIKATNQVSSEYILKGGHLLWKRIQIPRGTTDLDYAVRQIGAGVENDLQEACLANSKFEFIIESFTKRRIKSEPGFSVVISFREKEKATEEKRFTTDGRLIGYSKFSIDIAVDPDIDAESMIIDGQPVHVATLVNHFLDKLDACTRRGSENTRIKDFDDLVRIINSDEKIDSRQLVLLARRRGIGLKISPDIVDENFLEVWRRYFEIEYSGELPAFASEPGQAIEYINEFLFKAAARA